MSENTQDVSHMTRHEQSQDKSVKVGDGGIANRADATIHDRTGLYISIIALILSAMALGTTFMVPRLIEARIESLSNEVSQAEREARVMQERWNDLKVELAKRGIAVSDH